MESNSAFYGESMRPSVADVLATLCKLTGSDFCARELMEASDSVERECSQAFFMAMPEWIQ